jgi:hypothetical protein
MKLLIKQSSPHSCHFLPLKSKYPPKNPVQKYICVWILRKRLSFK